MIITEENLKKLKALATVWNELDRYVWLREDDKGRYIEYAFIDGTPHDNRCLSWYEKPHPNYFAKHPDLRQGRIKEINQIYKLYEYCCGLNKEISNNHCSAGHPKVDCSYIIAGKGDNEQFRSWTYEEPIKCACWNLSIIKDSDIEDSRIPADMAQKYLDILNEK